MKRGFTLIELLIVVAILAILAAIAVPNFLEAMTRSKVARVRSDLRTLAIALDAYSVDHNAYPFASSFFSPLPSRRLHPLTTPVAYLTTIPADPFQRTTTENYEAAMKAYAPREPLNTYLYNQATSQFGLGAAEGHANRMSWSLTSGGPDLSISFPYYAFAENFVQSGSYVLYLYDPTNGTVSSGEIIRRGGAARTPLPGIDTW